MIPARLAVVLLIVLELLFALTIHDSLFLNVQMLIHPIGAVKHWQAPK